MRQIRGFVAATLDGYIAAPDGGIDWLDEFSKLDYGYGAFIAQIDTLIIGRRSYDQVQEMMAWPYTGKRTLIVTHRPVEKLPEQTETWSGDVPDLVRSLRAAPGKDVWVIGGADVQQQFLDAGGLDRVEVHIIPILLGDGIPLWPRSEQRHRLQLRSADTLDGGMVRLDYDIRPAA